MTPQEKSRMINWAVQSHADVNHRYDEFPYSVHLFFVSNIGYRFRHLIPENDWDDVHVALHCHDLIEDARKTYNDVRGNTTSIAADITYALTNEKGKTRAERANDKYYEEMKLVTYAPFSKTCDRLGNQIYSLLTESRMAELYLKEADHFMQKVYVPGYDEIFDYLRNISTVSKDELWELAPVTLRAKYNI